MAWVNALLLWLHLGALALGGAATFGLPVVGARMGAAEPAGKQALVGVIMALTKLSNIALSTLFVTGLILVWSKYGGPGHMPLWFWVKMMLLVGLIGAIHMGRATAKKAMGGDTAAAARQPTLSRIGIGLFLLVVLTAVLAFH